MWRAYQLARPDLLLPSDQENIITDRPFPFSVEVKSKVSAEWVKTLYRDVLNGTDADLQEGLAAGPFRNPTRYNGEGGELQVVGYFLRGFTVRYTL